MHSNKLDYFKLLEGYNVTDSQIERLISMQGIDSELNELVGQELQELHIMDGEVLILNYSIGRHEYSLVIDKFASQFMLQDYMINIAESHEVELIIDYLKKD